MITAVEKVKAIRDAGYKVSVRHFRHVYPPGEPDKVVWLTLFEVPDGWVIEGHGGQTSVSVFAVDDATEVQIARGRAMCSKEDLFERRKGFELATQRAIAEAPELRAVIGAFVSEKEAAAS